MLTAPLIVDVMQVLTNDKPEIDIIYLSMAIVGALIGSGVRIIKDYLDKSIYINFIKSVFISLCSIIGGYAVYVFLIESNYVRYMGLLSIIIGIIGVDIILFFIKQTPTILKDIRIIAVDALRYFTNKKIGKK